MNATTKGRALVTGASTGIGAVYADRLAKQGYDLLLTARSTDRLRSLADSIGAETGRSIDVLPADLTNSRDLRIVEDILRTDQTVTMLVNNAGIGATTPLLETDVDSMESMIDLNITSLMRLAYAAAPGFAARSRGAIVNVGSVVALSPEALNGVYSGTKAFVLAFSQSLHHELSGRGVRIQAVLPGATATEFWGAAGTSVEQLPPEIVMSAEALVDAALVGFERGELVTIPALPDAADWDRYEAARTAMGPRLSRATPAARYTSICDLAG